MPSEGGGGFIRIALAFLTKVRQRAQQGDGSSSAASFGSGNAPDGLGPRRPPAGPLLANEGLPLTSAQGLQSRAEGLFQDVVRGTHGDPASAYLWTVDQRGVNVALESTSYPTPSGTIMHTNLSSQASMGGEAWFGPDNSVTINGSGRFGEGAGVTPGQWDAAASYWRSLGYDVNPIPFGQR